MSNLLPISQLAKSKGSLRIGDLAKQVGKSTRAVRLYEGLGLLGPTDRTEGGHRVYGEEALVRLGWIDRLQLLGMSLQEIRTFLDELEAHSGPDAMDRVRGMFRTKLSEVQQQVRSLQSLSAELEEGLEYLEACHTCAPTNDLGDCKACSQDHATEAPLLITGIHQHGEGK